MENETLKDLTMDLDHTLGSINTRREVFNAIKNELGLMQDDVENTDQMDKPIAWYKLQEIRSMLLILTELMQYSVEEFNNDFEKCADIKEKIFDIVVKGEC